jgi:hypothetical protein
MNMQNPGEDDRSNSEPTRPLVDYARENVAIRDLVAWFIGSMIGAYLGFRAGLFIESNLILFVSGIIGWLVGGIGGMLVISLFARSTPKGVVSVRTASAVVLGSLVGGFAGGLIGRLAGLPEIVFAFSGAIAGAIAGWLIGAASTGRLLKKDEDVKN